MHLSKYSKKYDLNLYILGKRNEHQLEYNFYHNIFKNKIKWKFLRHGKYNPYKIIDSSKIVCNLYSTLGYESFSRGNKTIFFNPYKKSLKSLTFGWPCENFKSEGPFWTEKISYNNIEKIINSVKLMNKNKFVNLRKKYINDLMIYDARNSELKKMLSNFCL
jgi:surface carbohydrate biosynthesis protein